MSVPIIVVPAVSSAADRVLTADEYVALKRLADGGDHPELAVINDRGLQDVLVRKGWITYQGNHPLHPRGRTLTITAAGTTALVGH